MLQRLYSGNLKWYFNLLISKILSIIYYPFVSKRIGKGTLIISPIFITPAHISIGNKVMIWPNARIEGVSNRFGVSFTPHIEIGNEVSIEQNLHLTCAGSIKIGTGTAIAANVTITDINHQYEDIQISPERQPIEVKHVSIGENCKLYNNSVILPGVHLGRHTILAANSVVMAGVYEDFIVLAGSPARIVKRYDPISKTWKKSGVNGNIK
jgi:acetyltransferase-like isoleucine patch superfamily enzyme